MGQLMSAIPSEKLIEMYEQSCLKTKLAQARAAKEGAPAARSVAAKRINTKRLPVNFRATPHAPLRRDTSPAAGDSSKGFLKEILHRFPRPPVRLFAVTNGIRSFRIRGRRICKAMHRVTVDIHLPIHTCIAHF